MKLIRIMIYKQNLIIKTWGEKWGKKIAIFCQLEFSSKIKVPQLGSAQLGSEPS